MTLRGKTLLIVGLTLIGLVSLLYVITRSMLLNDFLAIEMRQVTGSVRQVLGALDADLEALNLIARDYARRDDTYEFLETGDAAYIRSNLADATFIDAELNAVVLVNDDGTIAFARGFDVRTQEEVALPAVLADPANALPLLLEHPGPTTPVAGLIVADDAAMLVSSYPVLRSDKSGPAPGTLIMAQRLDDTRRRRLAERTQLHLSLVPVASGHLAPSADAALRALASGAEVHIEPRDGGLISGYAIATDILGEPAVLLQVNQDRVVYRQGRRTLAYILASLVLSGLVFGGVTIMLLERLVVRRVTRLSEAVRRIGEGGEVSARLPRSGHDEVADLTTSINDTFDSLERSQGALQYIGQHARCILWSAMLQEKGTGSDFIWDFRIPDEDAAQRVLPLDVFHGGSYAHAWRRSVHKEDDDRIRAAPMVAIKAGQSSYQQEFRVQGEDGSEHWIHEEVDIEPAGNGQWRLVGVCTDLTARKHAEAEMQRARDAALDLAATKSDFLANMSHEIRTPMNGIVGMTDLLRESGVTDEQREYLDMIGASADTLLRVINDVLDFSKIEAGRLDLDDTEFSVRQAIGESLSLLAVRAQQKGLELAFEVDADVPDAVRGDAVRLRQVLVNLVGNAIKFTETGEISVQVAAEPVGPDQLYLSCAVADTGIGIPEEKQRVIFQAFRQADSSTTRRFGGTGLGLAISTQLVERMHGRMSVESEAGVGSVFRFRVLLSRGSTAAPTPEDTAPGFAGHRGLVVDDNETSRGIVERMLQRWGIETVVAGGAAEARDAIGLAREADAAFDLVVSDVVMPGEDGFDLAGELLDDPEFGGVIILMLTAVDRAGDTARCRDLGVSAVVTKPVRVADLRVAVATAIGVGGGGAAFQAAAGGDDGGRGEAPDALRVLLAEDNPVNQRVALRMLEKRGHRVKVVGDGPAALAALERDAFDVVLMDIQMPGLSGFETTAQIRAREAGTDRHMPVVAMTAHALAGDRERCLEAGMDGYVAKPINATALLGEIGRLVAAGGGAGGTAATDDERDDAGTGEAGADVLFDRQGALERLGGDEALLDEVIDLFLADYPKQRATLRDAAERGDFETLGRATHTLRGALGNLDAARAGTASEALEAAAETGDAVTARRRLKALEAEVESLVPILHASKRDRAT